MNAVPAHIAMIMDGNGRWAKQRGKPRLFGHEAGAKTVRCVMDLCHAAGVKYLTLYAFSTENWSRPKDEVNGLMKLLDTFLRRNEKELVQKHVRFRVIGRRSDLSDALRKRIEQVETATRAFDYQLIIALSYGGRAEIVDAMRQMAVDVAAGDLTAPEITEDAVRRYLYAPDIPDPDLIIRTSGEFRVSNFLLWQCAYSEFFITPVLWPDFDEVVFTAALEAFAQRDRRLGGVHAVHEEEKK